MVPAGMGRFEAFQEAQYAGDWCVCVLVCVTRVAVCRLVVVKFSRVLVLTPVSAGCAVAAVSRGLKLCVCVRARA